MSDNLTGQILASRALQRRQSPRADFARQLMQASTPTPTPLAAVARALTGGIGGYILGQEQRAEDDRLEREFAAVRDFETQRAAAGQAELQGVLSRFGIGGAPAQPAPMPPMPPMPTPNTPGAPMPAGPGPNYGRNAGALAARDAALDAAEGGDTSALPNASTARVAAAGAPLVNPARPGAAAPVPNWDAGLAPPTGRIPGATGAPPAAPQAAPGAAPRGGPDYMGAGMALLAMRDPQARALGQALITIGQQQAARGERPPQALSPGQTLFDTNTGRPLLTVPERPSETERLLGDWRRLVALGDRATPEQAAERDILGQRLRGAGVQIDQRGPNAFEQERGKTLAEEETNVRNAGSRARQTLARVGSIERALDQFQTGAGAGLSLTAGQIAQRLGVPDGMLERLGISRDQVAQGESIRSLSSQMLLGMIGPGGFPAQNFSNADREMLERALPSLLNSPQGNRLIGSILRAQAQREIEISDSWNAWRRRNGTSMESFDRWNLEERPRLTERDVMAPLLEGVLPNARDPGAMTRAGEPGRPPAPPPQPGTVMDGFRFRGGNPADRNNWERVR